MATEARAAGGGSSARGLRMAAMGATAGLAAGAVVGGAGGRLAMLILRLTSDASIRGLESDDGFTMGIVSSQTTFLLVLTAVLGAVGGLAYVVVRAWLPSSHRPLLFAVLTGVVGGSLVIHPDGVDFTLLRPLWLAVTLFVALPTAYGLSTAILVERWLRGADRASRRWLLALVPALLPLALLGPRGVPILALALLTIFAADARSPIGRFVVSRPVVWLGRAVIGAAGLAATAALVGDVADIL